MKQTQNIWEKLILHGLVPLNEPTYFNFQCIPYKQSDAGFSN